MMLFDTYWAPAWVLWLHAIANGCEGVLGLVLIVELPRVVSGWWARTGRWLLAAKVTLTFGAFAAVCKLALRPTVSADEALIRLMGPSTVIRLETVSLLAWAVGVLMWHRRDDRATA